MNQRCKIDFPLFFKSHLSKVVSSVPKNPELCLYGPTCLVVLFYALQFISDTEEEDHDSLAQAISCLIQDTFSETSDGSTWEFMLDADKFCDMYVYDFMPEVQKLFTVQLPPLISDNDRSDKRNEILAGFMDFLIQIWNTQGSGMIEDENSEEEDDEDQSESNNDEVESNNPSNDGENEDEEDVNDDLTEGEDDTTKEMWLDQTDEKGKNENMEEEAADDDDDDDDDEEEEEEEEEGEEEEEEEKGEGEEERNLHNHLKYLLSFLGDVPFQYTQLDDLNTLLAEFEILANELGNFTFSFILINQPSKSIEFRAGADALLQKVQLLYAHIKKYCTMFSQLTLYIPPRVTNDAVDSFFIIESLLSDIENIISRHFSVCIDGMEDQFEALHEGLNLVRSFLKQTKVSRDIENGALKECFSMIRDITYEAEYLISSNVVGNLPTWYLKLRLPVIIQMLKLNSSKIQELKSSCEIMPINNDFSRGVPRQPTSAQQQVIGSLLVGFQEEKMKILDNLTGGSKGLGIVSLIGMPGLGKSTLAKNLFESSSVRVYFDRHAWCVISQKFERRNAFLEILTSLMRKDEKDDLVYLDDESLGSKIYQSLKGHRYLVIIDDIWDSRTWYDIKRYFPDDDNNGSRIILTSRIKDASPKGSTCYELPLLSVVESLDLLVRKVFDIGTCPPGLVDIGERIARKCHGLPLAIVVVAGILANSDKQKELWEKVEKHLDSIFEGPKGCGEVLEFSYGHMPNHLKLCYLYLGTFPEDKEIKVQKLILLWIAEGFIQKEEGKNQEDVALEYLYELINRSLVLIMKMNYDGGIRACGIHDLLRDMCLKKAGEENFMKYTKEHFSIYERYRRLRVDCTRPTELLRHFSLHCRSFSGRLPAPAFRSINMPLLRVMDLVPIPVTYSDPLNRIGFLVHLRYLTIHRMLPNQVLEDLVNLEVLNIKQVAHQNVEIITPDILKMVKLRHLNIRYSAIFGEDCNESCQATNLQSLSYIKFNSQDDEKMLKCCPNIRKLKCMCDPSVFPDTSFLAKLESLTMSFKVSYEGELAKVNFPSTIKNLTLYETGLPWDEMSKIGKLPNLQVLELINDAFVGDEWETSDDQFQKLRLLLLHRNNLKQWITSSKHFPQLKDLMVVECNELQDIPSDLGFITTLQMISVNESSYEASVCAIMIEEEQRDNGNKELIAVITSNRWTKDQLLQECREEED